MKAYQLTGIRQLALREVPDPELRHPTDVLVRVGAVGLCGSDIHYYTTGRIGQMVVEYPFTLGHECAGTVAAVGAAVTSVRIGDRVAIEPAIHCGECDQCLAGRENTCRQNRFLGCPGQLEGSLSEYLVMPQQNCFPLNPQLGLAEATISEPLAIGIYALRQSAMTPEARIGILGLGPIGRTVLWPARHFGCAAAYATDVVDDRCAAGRRAGATWVGNPQRENVVAAILEREPRGLDVVFDCCGKQEALDQAIALLRPGGTLMVIGIPEVDTIRFDPDLLRRKELSIVHVRRQRGCVSDALRLIAQDPDEASGLITHRCSFDDVPAAFDMVAHYRDGVVKAMIELP